MHVHAADIITIDVRYDDLFYLLVIKLYLFSLSKINYHCNILNCYKAPSWHVPLAYSSCLLKALRRFAGLGRCNSSVNIGLFRTTYGWDTEKCSGLVTGRLKDVSCFVMSQTSFRTCKPKYIFCPLLTHIIRNGDRGLGCPGVKKACCRMWIGWIQINWVST